MISQAAQIKSVGLPTPAVNKLQNQSQGEQRKNCFRCSRKHAEECCFKEAICNFCNKRGHIKSECRAFRAHQGQQISGRFQGGKRNMSQPNILNQEQEYEEQAETDECYDMFTLKKTT